MKAYYVNKTEVDKAYIKGVSKGANGALNHVLNICMHTLEEKYNWSVEQINEYKGHVIDSIKHINDYVLNGVEINDEIENNNKE